MKILRFFENKGVSVILFPLLSILLGMLGAGIIIRLIGVNPIEAYREMLLGSFGSSYGFFGYASQVYAPGLYRFSCNLSL
ncbi:MAG: hypothetical protein ACOX1Y_13905 [Zhaonellaceae bacterium]